LDKIILDNVIRALNGRELIEKLRQKPDTTPRHIEYIRQRLFEEFGVHNRVELALFASSGGMTE
jgi:hypothetical protein